MESVGAGPFLSGIETRMVGSGSDRGAPSKNPCDLARWHRKYPFCFLYWVYTPNCGRRSKKPHGPADILPASKTAVQVRNVSNLKVREFTF